MKLGLKRKIRRNQYIYFNVFINVNVKKLNYCTCDIIVNIVIRSPKTLKSPWTTVIFDATINHAHHESKRENLGHFITILLGVLLMATIVASVEYYREVRRAQKEYEKAKGLLKILSLVLIENLNGKLIN